MLSHCGLNDIFLTSNGVMYLYKCALTTVIQVCKRFCLDPILEQQKLVTFRRYQTELSVVSLSGCLLAQSLGGCEYSGVPLSEAPRFHQRSSSDGAGAYLGRRAW